MRAFNKRMIYNINLLAIILCCLLFAVYYTAKRAIMVNMLVNHSKEILSSASKIQLLAAQSGMLARRYLLTGEVSSTTKFANIKKSLAWNLGQFKTLTAEDLSMRPALDSLTVYIGKRIVLSTEMIQVRQRSGFLPALTYLQNHTGGNYVDEADKYNNLINAQNQLKGAAASLNYNSETYRVAVEQLKTGLINMVEFLQQKALYTQAQQQFLQAKYTTALTYRIYDFYKGYRQ